MSKALVFAALAFGCVSCATPGSLVLPPIPGAPDAWPAFSTSTIPGSECPPIEGVYLEPPSVNRVGADKKYLPKDDEWLFFGYVPFSLADRTVRAPATYEVPKSGFVIRQSSALEFHFLFFNHQATAIAEYRFQAVEGDFNCRGGYIEFPVLSSYVMIEGTSDNFQIRNVLLLDETGALVIQSTRGPYRGSPAKMAREVSYEFFRYARSEEQNK